MIPSDEPVTFECGSSAAARRRQSSISASASARPTQSNPSTFLPGSSSLYTSKKCWISSRSKAETSPMSRRRAIRGSVATTQSTLSSAPFSSRIRNMPIARQWMTHPGKVGSSSSTSASSGSPSSASVSSMKP